jgi:HNH endonuclease
MATINISRLSNDDLITETKKAAANERHATVQLVALLAEFDARRLYLGQGCSSLFAYCTSVLHLSEHAAYHRIEAARAARQFPVILERLAEGEVTLTTIGLLRPHMTADNHIALLDAARHQSKREVERLIAGLAPKADVAPMVRRLAVIKPLSAAPPAHKPSAAARAAPPELPAGPAARPLALKAPTVRSVDCPSSSDRYLLRLTIGGDTHAKLQRARDLLRHTIPSGDPAAIVDRALTVLVEQLERTKIAATRPEPGRYGRNERAGASESRERSGAHGVRAPRQARGDLSGPKVASERVAGPRGRAPGLRTRHIPAAVRREVWARDGGHCTFVGPEGRCRETGRLEFHHVTPYARGGRTDATNLVLRCRAHNAYDARLAFGDRQPWLNGSAPD